MEEGAKATQYINPVPGGLVLTGIVVAVSTTALFLALTIRLYRQYHSVNLDVILMLAWEGKARNKPLDKREEVKQMPLTYNIPMFSILLVLMSAMVIPFFPKKSWGLHLIRGVEVVVAALSALLLVQLSEAGESFTYQMGHFPAPWGNLLRCGPLEALLALTFSLVMLLSLCAGAEDIRRDVRADRQGSYCLLTQLLFGALLAMIYTDDLFTAYVFIEIAAVTACMAVVAKESGRSVVSAIRYLIFSCLGSGLVLLGIALLYCITGQLLFSSLEEAVLQLVVSRTYTLPLVVSALLMTLGLSIKSAQFPFHAWLPDAHASATTASSAVLSGLVLKGYLIILLKLILRVYGPSLLATTYMDDLLFLLGLTGMLFASVAALRQEEVKGMIAYLLLRPDLLHLPGLGLGTDAGSSPPAIRFWPTP